jgi:hypothetical protein
MQGVCWLCRPPGQRQLQARAVLALGRRPLCSLCTPPPRLLVLLSLVSQARALAAHEEMTRGYSKLK